MINQLEYSLTDPYNNHGYYDAYDKDDPLLLMFDYYKLYLTIYDEYALIFSCEFIRSSYMVQWVMCNRGTAGRNFNEL